jgi:integrase
MATIKKKLNKKGTVWWIDYYDPKGKRCRKDFELKKDAEAYLGKVRAAKKEGRYFDVFDVKKETLVTFNELADRLQELLGHADIKMTMRYAHLSQAHLKEAVAMLNNFGHGHKMDTNSRQNKKADSLTPANLL